MKRCLIALLLIAPVSIASQQESVKKEQMTYRAAVSIYGGGLIYSRIVEYCIQYNKTKYKELIPLNEAWYEANKGVMVLSKNILDKHPNEEQSAKTDKLIESFGAYISQAIAEAPDKNCNETLNDYKTKNLNLKHKKPKNYNILMNYINELKKELNND